MSFLSVIKKIGDGISKVGQAIGGFLPTKVKDFFGNVDGVFGALSGFGKSVEGMFGTIKNLFKNPRDLLNPEKLLSVLNPTGLLNEFSNLRRAIERILGGVGGMETLGVEHKENLVRAAQASAWQMAVQRYG